MKNNISKVVLHSSQHPTFSKKIFQIFTVIIKKPVQIKRTSSVYQLPVNFPWRNRDKGKGIASYYIAQSTLVLYSNNEIVDSIDRVS